MNRFETLLDRYLNHTASKDETAELFRLIDSGAYDDIIGNNVIQAVQDELLVLPSQGEKDRMAGIFNEKLASRIAVPEVREGKLLKMRSWLSAAAAVAGILFGAWWFLDNHPDNLPLSIRKEVKHAPVADLHLARFSDKQLVHFPDGSTALLNEGSELAYNQEDFGNGGREVTLSGEAFFDVRHNPASPFIVHTGPIQTTVLGTAFNVATSAGTKQVRITVTRGKVKVGDQTRTYDVITPDEQLIVNTSTNNYTKEYVDAKLVAGWKDQFVILDNVTMREAMAVLAERFHVKLTLSNPGLEKCHVSASFFNGENLEHILKVIAAVNQITYSIHADGTVTLDGGTSCQ